MANEDVVDTVLRVFIGSEIERLPLPPPVPSPERIEADLQDALRLAARMGDTLRPLKRGAR